MRTISDIIRDAGGAKAVAAACGEKVSSDAVYKWPTIGIPDRHWSALMSLTDVTPTELFEANRVARGSGQGAVPTTEAAE